MIKKILITVFASTAFLSCEAMSMSCPTAAPSGSSQFCSSFKPVAQCHCIASGFRGEMCTNMALLYARMIAGLGSLQRACEYQHNTSTQVCIDDWNCYRNGGTNSQNELCNGTGAACM